MNKTIEKVFIAADHRGVGLKLYLIEMLSAAGYNVVNLGTDDLNTPVDFPDVAKTLSDAMIDEPETRGILVCGTGAGVQLPQTVIATFVHHVATAQTRHATTVFMMI